MKKFLFLLFSFSFSTFSFGQELNTPYVFPVKPGTEQWANLKTSRQKDSVCVIPSDVLKALSTKALLITCLNYPRKIDFYSSDNRQKAYNFYTKHFNGLSELIKRPDLSKILFQFYLDIDLPLGRYNRNTSKISGMQIEIVELLISQETIINQYEKSEKSALLSEAVKKMEQRQKLEQSFHEQITSALILSRVLCSENKCLTGFDKFGNDVFSIFNSSAIVLDLSIFEKILEASKKPL